MADQAKEEDRAFSWFLCAQKYLDPESELYVVEPRPGDRFYCDQIGQTLLQPDRERRKVVILNNSFNLNFFQQTGLYPRSQVGLVPTPGHDQYLFQPDSQWMRPEVVARILDHPSLARAGIVGAAAHHLCTLGYSSPLCEEVTFFYPEGYLFRTTDQQSSALIQYAKSRNTSLRRTIPDFPTCQQIDQCIRDFSCGSVCRALRELLVSNSPRQGRESGRFRLPTVAP